MPRWIRTIDAISALAGRLATWGIVAMILVGAWNTLGRFAGRWLGMRLTTNTLLEAQWYIFSLVFLFGAAWVMRTDGHVRVDVLASRFSSRQRAWLDLAGHLLILMPFVVVTMVLAWPVVRFSWLVREGSPDPGGLPRWPLKVALLLALVLLVAQAMAEIGRRVVELRCPPEGSE